MSKLTEIIEQFNSNKKLYYDDRNIGFNGAKLLADAIKNNEISELSELHLKGNIGGSEGTKCLVKAVMISSNLLSKLNLENCKIGDNGAKALAEAAKKGVFCNLVDLKLYRNNITSIGAKALAEAAEEHFFPKLSILHLSSNKISDNGAKALAEAAKNQGFPKLEVLHLYWNNIGYDGIKELITSYRDSRTAFPALLDLNLNENRIGDDGLEIFQDTACYLRTLEIREDSGSKGWFTGNQGFAARKITVQGINELKKAGKKGFFPILSYLNISGNGWNIQEAHKLVDTLKLENEENTEVYFPALSSLEYKNFQIWQVWINCIIENIYHCHRNILYKLNLKEKADRNCKAKSHAENKLGNEVWERLPGIVKESFIAVARADLLKDHKAKIDQLSAAINMMTKYYINNDDIENEFKSIIQWWKELVTINLEDGKKLFNITLLDKNNIYYKEIKDLIVEELRKSTQENFRHLSEALGNNTEELDKIRFILETKSNLEDLEYVNERLEEISNSEYNNAQRIEMIYQMVGVIQQRLSSQENNYAVFSISEIKYDNELLNHPKLMNILASKYGINRAVDISSSLSTTLIQEVTATDNYELLLAGAGSIYLMEVE